MSISDLKDEEIIDKLKALAEKRPDFRDVEEQYFNEIFKRYSNQAYSLSRYYGLKSNDAKDVVQQAFINLYNKIGYFDPARPFKPYFLKIVHNLTKNKHAELKRRSHITLEDIADENLEKKENFNEILEKRQYLFCIINRLPEKFRDVFVLKYHADLENTEIALTLGINVKTVYYRLDKGNRLLKKILEEKL